MSDIVARLHEFVVIPGNAIRSLVNKAANRIEQLESELAKTARRPPPSSDKIDTAFKRATDC
jgi:hypothetical protein